MNFDSNQAEIFVEQINDNYDFIANLVFEVSPVYPNIFRFVPKNELTHELIFCLLGLTSNIRLSNAN